MVQLEDPSFLGPFQFSAAAHPLDLLSEVGALSVWCSGHITWAGMWSGPGQQMPRLLPPTMTYISPVSPLQARRELCVFGFIPGVCMDVPEAPCILSQMELKLLVLPMGFSPGYVHYRFNETEK